MRISYIFLIAICMAFLIGACRQHDRIKPLKFTAYGNNPILSPGPAGSWDDQFIILPHVIKHQDVFYLFYSGSNSKIREAIGLATSNDGINYVKYGGNPVLSSDSSGMDAYGVGAPVILKTDSLWVMYYNCNEMVHWGPGPNIGRATSKDLKGPWKKDPHPVLTVGKREDWDSEFVFPVSILRIDDGTYRMYYSGGDLLVNHDNFFIGMASSPDGITWTKYDEPATGTDPYSNSDPVLKDSPDGAWDDNSIFTACIYRDAGGYKMYYTGSRIIDHWTHEKFGFASSSDGIHWERYSGNPVYSVDDDPYAMSHQKYNILPGEISEKMNSLEGPWIVFADTLCLMYYDYTPAFDGIGLAIAPANLLIAK